MGMTGNRYDHDGSWISEEAHEQLNFRQERSLELSQMMIAQKRAWHFIPHVNFVQGSPGRSKLFHLGEIQDILENAEAIEVNNQGTNEDGYSIRSSRDLESVDECSGKSGSKIHRAFKCGKKSTTLPQGTRDGGNTRPLHTPSRVTKKSGGIVEMHPRGPGSPIRTITSH